MRIHRNGVLLVFLALFVAIVGPSTPALANIDEKVREVVIDTDKGFINESMHVITYLGDGVVDYTIASVLPDKEARLKAQRAVLVSVAAALILKVVIGMKRPPGPVEFRPFSVDPEYHAMPSGHTAAAFALATAAADYYPKYKVLAYTLATLVGISRLYEDVHWFSNVVAGAGIGYLGAKFVEYRW